jgi:hypothetical protein
MMRAPRDMSRREFRAALARRGWRQVLLWIEVGEGRAVGMVMVGGRVNRRASLAHAIREHAVRETETAVREAPHERR